jgi:ribosomal protein S18 acetylase RimI-like enzyme
MNKSAKIEIFPILPEDPRLDQVAELFRQLYDSEADLGTSIKLVEGGEKIWRRTIEKMLGKFAQIIIAADGNTVAGFIYGSIRITPVYFGGLIVGYLDAILVQPEYRKMGIANQMMLQLMDWWKEKDATIFEVERLIVNENAARQYEKLGFKEELVKHRKKA